jgi:hypothetical protein
MAAGCSRAPDPVTIHVPKALLQKIEALRPPGSVFLTSAKSPLTAFKDLGPKGLVALTINPAKDKGEALSTFALKFTMSGAVSADATSQVGFSMVPTPDVFVSQAVSPPKLVIAWEEDRARIEGAREVRFVPLQQ